MCVLGKMSGEGDEHRAETNSSEAMDATEGGGELTFGWREVGNMGGRVALKQFLCVYAWEMSNAIP